MLMLYFDNSIIQLLASSWIGLVGSSQGKWTRGHFCKSLVSVGIISSCTIRSSKAYYARNVPSTPVIIVQPNYVVIRVGLEDDTIYRVGQLKWGQLTFVMVTFECIGKNSINFGKCDNSNSGTHLGKHKSLISPDGGTKVRHFRPCHISHFTYPYVLAEAYNCTFSES